MELNYQVHDWVSRPYLISESKNAISIFRAEGNKKLVLKGEVSVEEMRAWFKGFELFLSHWYFKTETTGVSGQSLRLV